MLDVQGAASAMLQEGELGVHPPGALGVGFFIHAGAESFVGRGGDGITQPLKEVGALKLQDETSDEEKGRRLEA